MSISINSKLEGRSRRRIRVRKKVFGTQERPRVSIFRSVRHMNVQVVDDEQGKTLVNVHSHGKSGVSVEGKKSDVAQALGQALAQACKDKGISSVVFDRGGFRYHGRVKAVADAARNGGLKF